MIIVTTCHCPVCRVVLDFWCLICVYTSYSWCVMTFFSLLHCITFCIVLCCKLLIQSAMWCSVLYLILLLGDDFLLVDELVSVLLQDRRLRANLLVHGGLREHWLVSFVVTVTSITHLPHIHITCSIVINVHLPVLRQNCVRLLINYSCLFSSAKLLQV